MTNIGYATLDVIPSMKDFGKKLSDGAAPGIKSAGAAGGSALGGGILGGASAAVAPLAGILAGVFAVGAVKNWAKESIAAVANWETINAQTSSAIASTGGVANVSASHVHDLAQSLEGLTATEAESIQSGANMLLTFKNIQNGVGAGNDIFDQATSSLVDMSRAMGTDPQSAAIQLGKALNDPIAGISALSRVGIQFTDDQKGLIQSLVDSGQTMEAQKIILGELNSQFGGSGAAYANTYAGQIYRLSDAWGDFGEQIFSAAMPALGGIAGGLTNLLNNHLTPFVTNVQGGFAIVSAAFRGVKTDGDILEPSLAGPLMAVGTTLRTVFDSIGAVVGPVFSTIGAAFAPLMPVFAALIPQLLQLWTSFSPLSLILQALAPVLPQIAGMFAGLAASLGGALGQALSGLLPTLSQLAATVTGVLTSSFQAFLPVTMQLIGLLTGQLGATLGLLVPIISEVAGILGETLGSVMKTLAPVLATMADALGQVLTAVAPLLGALLPPLMAIIGPLVQLLAPLMDLAMVILQPLIALFTSLVGIIGPILTPIIEALTPILTGVASAIGSVLTPAIGIITDVLGGLIEFLTGVFTGDWDKAWGGIVQIFSGIWDGISEMAKGALNGLIDIINGMIGGVNSITGAIGIPAIPTIPGLQNGGTVTRGGAVLVGERGPEILRLPRGAEVDPDISSRNQVFRSPQLDGSTSARGGGGDPTGPAPQVIVNPAPGMSEQTIGIVAARELQFSLRTRGSF